MITHDTHIHTYYSKDASKDATFEAYIQQAKQLGITSLTFTDHHDIDPAHPLFKEPIDFDAYIKHFIEVKKSSDVAIHLGVEVGYQTHVKEEIKDFLKTYPFEHVILSVHYVEKKRLVYTSIFQR